MVLDMAVAIITFVGTALVAALGFLQWSRTQRSNIGKEHQERRTEALTTVWSSICDIDMEQRVLIARKVTFTQDRKD